MAVVCQGPVSSSGRWRTSGRVAGAERVVSTASPECGGWPSVAVMECWVADDVGWRAGDAGGVLPGWMEVCVTESSSAMASNTHTCSYSNTSILSYGVRVNDRVGNIDRLTIG